MNDLILSLGSLFIGIVSSVWVSAYYFRRSLKKSLIPYIQYYSSPFKDLDVDVRSALKVTYQQESVEDLFEIQFLIANTGDKAIRDVIEPLALNIPEQCTLLDASIIHKQPNELKIDLIADKEINRVTINFPLLNSGDFFILKLLLNGTPKSDAWQFSIVVDELPPILKTERLNYDSIASSKKREFEFSLLGFGLLATFCGLAQFKVIYNELAYLPNFEGSLVNLFSKINLDTVAVVLTFISALIFFLIGVMMSAASFTEGRFPPSKKKFVVPEHIHKSHMRFIIRDSDNGNKPA